MIKSEYGLFLIFFAAVLIAVSCSKGIKNGESATEEILPDNIVELREDQIKLADISLGHIQLKPLGNSIKANGIISVAPMNHATVCIPMGGFVKYTSLLPGNSVRKGQTLAVIENPEFVNIQLEYLETRNKLNFAEADYKRHSELYKDDVYSEQNVQQVMVEYQNLKALARSLEQKLQLIGIDPAGLNVDNISNAVNLVSPIDGFLKTVNVNIGKYVTETDILFEIINSDKLFLELTLFEKDASHVAAGQKVRFFISNETEEHDAVITQTGRSVGEEMTFKAYASVKSKCVNLLPGMYINAYIEESDQMVPVLPSEAVVNFDDKDYIFIYERDKEEDGKPFTEYRMVEVKKEMTSSGYTQIILPRDFPADSIKVVVKGAYNLLSAKKNAGEMAC
jgi:cobalt-zinc-cadmium efflux system membrane fusion protein